MRHISRIWIPVAGLALAALLMAAAPATAEFYKYRDENGAMRFTDNLAEVPLDQQPKIRVYTGAEDFTPAPAKGAERSGSPDEDRRSSGSETAPPSPERTEESLLAEKALLEAEYQAIIETRDALGSQRAGLATPASYGRYNTNRGRLNQRAAAYEKRRMAFEASVREYNAGLSGAGGESQP